MTGAAPSFEPARRPRADAAERILRAAVRCIVESGAASLTMHDVAEEAGVSKGLIHYHFHDKETLLARVVEWMTRGIVTRERELLMRTPAREAIDAVWAWLDGETARGHLRVLIELAESKEALVRSAVRKSATARREAALVLTTQLFTLLGLKPRVPEQLLADVIVAFNDGLVVSTSLDPEGNPRAAFDVFWLSLLSLAE
ncbi:MAG TPA: TetR/AcrR family transcriptional regulator [Gemmatimonadaceae bacterium]|nr:TetR/AcrR family transcriptional regulator [Gemmatimonadaceae bacterium]